MGLATWQKATIVLAAIFFGYAGFDGTKEYGLFWQLFGMIIGGLTGAIGGFLYNCSHFWWEFRRRLRL